MHLASAGLIWVPLILLGIQTTLASPDTPPTNGVKVPEYPSINSRTHSRYMEGLEALLAADSLLESVGSLVESERTTDSYSADEQSDKNINSPAYLSHNTGSSNAGGEDVAIGMDSHIEDGQEPEFAPTATTEGEDEEEDEYEEDEYECEDHATSFIDNLNTVATERTLAGTRTADDSSAQPTRSAPSVANVHQRDPKSLKGRFNFASADCAAVVLKANKEAKGVTAILNPKKDQYMLNECSVDGKFVIVELCDDILIDTLVLGNYEFFSSTFKDTMVYVSDRYPPKNNTWTLLGHFQARNNRDAQVFPVHDPSIWAKYIKVDFLSHYGNEHYCPLTMFKVYGTTQMEQYRREEDEEDFADTATLTVDVLVGSPLREYQLNFPYQQPHQQQLRIDGKTGSPAKAFLRDIQGMVNKYEEGEDNEPHEPVREHPTIPRAPNLPWDRQDSLNHNHRSNNNNNNAGDNDDDEFEEGDDDIEEMEDAGGGNIGVALDIDTLIPDMKESLPLRENMGSAGKASEGKEPSSGPASPVTTLKQRGQESIFKTIMRRLLRVERNVTLAYRYLEEQHMVFNLVLQQVELNNLANVQLAIKQLNHTSTKQMQSLTTLSEEIWRAILYDLEEYQQRTQSEMSEMSSKLEYLAEEVLFEKRMNVAQLALLLIIVVMVAASKVVTKLALIPESKKEK